MKLVKKITIWLSLGVTSLLFLASALSLLTNTSSRYLKMLDFPRIQFFVAGLVLFFVSILLLSTSKKLAYKLALLFAFLTVSIQAFYLYPYTQFAKKEVPQITSNEKTTFSLLLSNVFMENRTADQLLNQIEIHQPDVIIAMEVNGWWQDQFSDVRKIYPFVKEVPNEETYGMFLYSKFSFKDLTVKYIHHENIPSIHTTLSMNGKEVRLHAVHPPPPTFFEDLPDNKGKEEIALKAVGEMVKKDTLPSIVAGDLNDVAWSNTNQLMKANNKLYDVRVGRGLFNSYDSHKWYTRWPLDHVFVTKQFGVKKLQRLPDVSSDHFPILVELVLL